MIDDNDNIITSHTTNKVPFIICNNNYQVKDGKLGDIAPTILKIMNLEIPKEMTGNFLILK
jgi:2,3-bisphosphoglycerate-independent phosphoglycerate mutase